MSTSAMGHPAPRSAWFRVVMWLGHYGYLLFGAYALTVAAHVVAAHMHLLPRVGLAALALAVGELLGALTAVSAVAAQMVHDRHLCARDISEAPLGDPDPVVRARMRELRASHSIAFQVLGTAGVLALAFAPFAGGGGGSVWLLLVAGLLVVAYNAWVELTHRRLEPWCPFCRDDDGGGGDDATEPLPRPDPATTGTR